MTEATSPALNRPLRSYAQALAVSQTPEGAFERLRTAIEAARSACCDPNFTDYLPIGTINLNEVKDSLADLLVVFGEVQQDYEEWKARQEPVDRYETRVPMESDWEGL